MAVKDSVKAIPIAAFNTAGLAPILWKALTPVGGLAHSCFTIIIRNFSNVAVEVSYNETDVNEYVPADSTLTLEFQTNSLPNNQVAVLKKGTVISLRGAVGVGFIYMSGYYQEDQL